MDGPAEAAKVALEMLSSKALSEPLPPDDEDPANDVTYMTDRSTTPGPPSKPGGKPAPQGILKNANAVPKAPGVKAKLTVKEKKAREVWC